LSLEVNAGLLRELDGIPLPCTIWGELSLTEPGHNVRKSIFLTVDGLGTNLVGCYGNSVCPTPNLNTLASQSIVLDQFWGNCSDTIECLQSLWKGQHHLAPPSVDYSSWHEQLDSGILVTDDPRLAELDFPSPFRSVFLVEHRDDAEVSELETLLEVAMAEWMSEEDEFPLLWIHSRGLRGTWDAPLEFRQIMCDDGDPAPPNERSPMAMTVTEKTDPDEVFGISCALGGQVVLIDQVVGDFLTTLRDMKCDQNVLFGLIGLSGYPLGEHRIVGGESGPLYAESLHCPCVFRFGNLLPIGARYSTMMQPHDLGAWIEWWLDVDDEEEEVETGPGNITPIAEMLDRNIDTPTRVGAILATRETESFVATPAWSCRFVASVDGLVRHELFAKPDDRWEQNEVSQRATLIVDKMLALKDKLQKAYEQGLDGEPVNWFDEELVHPIR
jgi:hypothetical protein